MPFRVKNIRLLIVAAVCCGSLASAQGYICAVGGGGENYGSWSDAPYRWIVEKADSQGIIILATSPQTSWIPTYFMSFGAASAINYVIPSIAVANDSATYRAIRQARGVFIKGGDQWEYVSFWRGTLAEEAIREVFLAGGVVAGTSAGAMVLSSVVSDAHYGSAVSRGALRNPRSLNLSTTTNFLRLVPNTLIDTHFHERGRFGRLLVLVGNHYLDHAQAILGIGIEDLTALCITPDGVGEVMGSGSVNFYYPTEQSTVVSAANQPFVFTNVNFDALVAGYKYDLNSHQVSYVPPTAIVPGPGSSVPVVNKISLFGDGFPSADGMSKFFTDADGVGNPFVVVTSPAGAVAGQQYKDTLLARGASAVELLLLDVISANSPAAAQSIAGASGIVFTSNFSEQFPLYVDSTSLVGSALHLRMQTGVALAYASRDAMLAGKTVVFRTELEEYAAYRGKLTLGTGTRSLRDLLVMPLIFQSDVYDENRSTGLVWGMAKTDSRTGIYLDEGGYTSIDQNGLIESRGVTPSIIVDARNATHVGFSGYVASGGIGPRQSAAIIGAGIHSIAGDVRVNSQTGEVVTGIRVAQNPLVDSPLLLMNYPNPFNPLTTLEFHLARPSPVQLKVFNILGQEVAGLVDGPQRSGTHRIDFDASSLAAGMYFARLQTNNQLVTVKILLIK